MSLGYVYWADEPDRKLLVLRVCRRCGPLSERLSDVTVVSPAGIGHTAHLSEEGHTACGKDATHVDWWWRE